MTLADPAAPAPSSVSLDKPLYGASFTQAVARLFTKYAVFSGRASRSEFWWATFFVVLGSSLTWGAGIAVGLATGTPYVDPTTGRSSITPGPAFLIFAGVGMLFYLAILVPGIAVTVRRLHDGNYSGALYLLAFIPWIGGLILTIFALLESKPEGARFDADAQPYQPVPPPVGP